MEKDKTTIEAFPGIQDDKYIKISMKESLDMLDNNETFVMFLGFPACPYCRKAFPFFEEIRKVSYEDNVYYLNPKEYERDEIFKEFIQSYSKTFKEEIGKSGRKETNLYVPKFVYVKEGNIEYILDGTSIPDSGVFQNNAYYAFENIKS